MRVCWLCRALESRQSRALSYIAGVSCRVGARPLSFVGAARAVWVAYELPGVAVCVGAARVV